MILRGRTAIAVLVALAASMALNFVGIGYLASWSFGDRGARPIAAERLVSLGARSLPKPLRDEVATELKPKEAELRAAFRGVRDARRAVFQAMRAEPFDRAAVEAAFAVLRERLAVMSDIGQQAMLDALAKAPADERAKIGQRPMAPRS